MSEQDHHSEEAVNAALRQQRREGFDDLQKELSGLNVKDNRFLRDDDERSAQGRARKEREATATRLSILLSDPGYQALYNETMAALGDAETAVYDALVKASDLLKIAGEELDEAKARGVGANEVDALQKARDVARERHERMLERDRELADIRLRLEDPDNPPTLQELEKLKDRALEIKSDTHRDAAKEQALEVAEPEKDTQATVGLDLNGFSSPF